MTGEQTAVAAGWVIGVVGFVWLVGGWVAEARRRLQERDARRAAQEAADFDEHVTTAFVAVPYTDLRAWYASLLVDIRIRRHIEHAARYGTPLHPSLRGTVVAERATRGTVS